MHNTTLGLFFIIITSFSFAQNDTSTPYSLFGLGVENKTATGGSTALGNTGIAYKNSLEVNMYNPANLGNIRQKSFLYEFGINGMYSTLKTNSKSDTTNDFNMSHFAIAFPVSKRLGVSLGLLPYTKVGYDIDIEKGVTGSTDTYISRITGSGGLNRFYLAAGFKVYDRLSLGVELSSLFGSIDQETQIYYESLVTITDANFYKGFKFKTGLQYTLLKQAKKEITLGAIVELPTSVVGDQTRDSSKVYGDDYGVVIDSEAESDLDDFEIPLLYGFGITTTLNNALTTSFDIKKLKWSDTNQFQNNESYIDQTIYGAGIEYTSPENRSYWDLIKYRIGANYNTGFLSVENKRINSYFISTGLGLPLSDKARLNIAYSYGKEGTTSNGLIQENFHKITINLSFIGNWFNKSKIQ